MADLLETIFFSAHNNS